MFTLHGITKMILYVEKGLHNGYTWRMVFGLGAVWRITSDLLIAANLGQPWPIKANLRAGQLWPTSADFTLGWSRLP